MAADDRWLTSKEEASRLKRRFPELHRGLDLAPPDGNDVTNVFKTNSKNPVDSPNVICTVYLSFCSALACSVCNSPPARRKIGMVKQRFFIILPQITLGTEFCRASTSILDTFITDVAVRIQEVILILQVTMEALTPCRMLVISTRDLRYTRSGSQNRRHVTKLASFFQDRL